MEGLARAALPVVSPTAKGTDNKRFRKLPNLGLTWVIFANAANAVGISPREASVDVKRTFLLFFMLSFDRTCNFNTCSGFALPTNITPGASLNWHM